MNASLRLLSLVSSLALLAPLGCDPGDDGTPDGAALDPSQPPVEGRCDLDDPGDGEAWVDCVESFDPAPGVSFGHDAMPDIVLGPAQGAGEELGSTHVASLGCGGSITLAFGAPWPVDGPGPDFAVFENAFISGAITFVEPARVLVSEDGVDWYGWPCAPTGQEDPPSTCAGLRPVLEAPEGGTLAPEQAGGDRFDLADLGLTEIRYLRLVDRTREHYQSESWCAGAKGGFDLDAAATLEGNP